MVHRISTALSVTLFLSFFSAGCGGDDLSCGPGADKYGDRCVAKISSCASGTTLVDGVCVPACAANEVWSGTSCVTDRQCQEGTKLVNGACVPACDGEAYWDGQVCAKVPRCALGTVFDEQAGECVPNELVCGEGTHFDGEHCVPDTSECGPGTHLQGAECVPDTLPPPDVEESDDPVGAVFDVPDAGQSLTLGGIVGTPTDQDGDGYVDPDYDRFTFTATRGTWLRVHATSEGAAHPAFALVSEQDDGEGVPLYARYAVNPSGVDTEREFYLPRDGSYTLVVSDYAHVTADLFGWVTLPVGGDAFSYFVTVENLGDPAPTSVSSLPAVKYGSMAQGALSFYQLEDLQVHDARVIRNLGQPSGQPGNDVFAALMLFGPSGALVRENLAYATDADATLLFAATAAGDHSVVVDHLLAIGPGVAYEMRAEEVTTVDCGTSSCATGSLDAGTSKLLSWDVVEGTVFAAGVEVPDTATATLRMQMMDEGLVALGDPTSASKYGAGKLRRFFEEDQRVYLLLHGDQGAEIPSYALDVDAPVANSLVSGTVHGGLPVHEMPAVYSSAGFGRLTAAAGQVILSTGFSTAWPAWTNPVEAYLTTTFEAIPGMLDATAPAFPSAGMEPLMAYVPVSGTRLYQVTDGASGDIVGAIYDTTFHALTPVGLGTVLPGSSAQRMAQTVGGSGYTVFAFEAGSGQTAAISVAPQGPGIHADIWVATPGGPQYASGSYSWQSDEASSGLGVVARQSASGAGEAVSASHEVAYDGVHLVFVRHLGAGAPTDSFDLEVSVSN